MAGRYGPDVLLLGGTISAIGGVYLLLGLAWALILAGLLAVLFAVAIEVRQALAERKARR